MKLVFNDQLYARALEALLDRHLRHCSEASDRELLLRIAVKAWNLAVDEREAGLVQRAREHFLRLAAREGLSEPASDRWRRVFVTVATEKANIAPHLDNRIHKARYLEPRPDDGPAIDVTSIQMGPAG